MVKSWKRGHETEWDIEAKEWRYQDTGEIADYDRPCIKCKEMPMPEGCDPCIGHIEGAISACCGHGIFPMSIVYPEIEAAVDERRE